MAGRIGELEIKTGAKYRKKLSGIYSRRDIALAGITRLKQWSNGGGNTVAAKLIRKLLIYG